MKRRTPTVIAGRFIRFASARFPIRCCRILMRPMATAACVRRSRSNTPLQALTTLNEPLFLESAQALALRTLNEGGATDGQKMTYAFRRCVARRPTLQETAELLSLLRKQKQRLAEGWTSPWDLAGFDATKAPKMPRVPLRCSWLRGPWFQGCC